MSVLGSAAIGVMAAPGLDSVRMALADGTAWLVRGTDVAHASSSAGEADWLVPDVVDEEASGQARVGQDGDTTLVVDPVGGRGYSIDAVTLELGDPVEVDASAVPLVGGGQAYLVSDGEIRWLDPAGFETRATIQVPGRVQATIDADGILWAVTPRDGMLRRILRGDVTHEVRVTSPGRSVEVSLAGDRPVVHDTESGDLWFVNRRSGELDDPVTVPPGSVLQGPSPHSERAWVATPDSVLGVAADGDAIETRRPDAGTPHRPEVIDGRVVVATHDGRLTVLDEETGQLVTDQARPLPAATNADFQTFVKDGVLWFNAPQAEVAGTVAPDGTVQVIEVDEEGLRTREQGDADRDDQVNPNQVVTPAAPPTPTPTPSPGPSTTSPTTTAPTPVQPAPPPPPPSPPPAPVTTPTTQPTPTGPQTVAVPDLANQNVDQACAALQQQGLTCTRQPSGQYAEPAQTVLSQNPRAGIQVARGTPVALTYHESTGVVVPAAGERRDNACGPIDAAGLECNLIPGRSANPVQPEGVHAQNPAPGIRVGPGSTVNVTYDDHRWGVLYQFDNPAAGNYELILSTDSNAAPGWTRTILGRVFLEAAPGAVPLYCWEPNGDGGAQSHAYFMTNTSDGSDRFDHRRPCSGTPFAYVWDGTQRTVPGMWVWSFRGYSDRYYSTNENDPIGLSDYVGRESQGHKEMSFIVVPD